MNEIKDQLKSLRSLQQLICVAAAGVLAFAMTPDRSKDYQAALAELDAIRALSLNSYPVYVKGLFSQEERENNRLLVDASRKAGLVVEGTPRFSEAVVMDDPPNGPLSLGALDDFIQGQHTAGVFVIDPDEKAIAKRLTVALQAVQVPVTLNGISFLSGGSERYYPPDVRAIDPVIVPNSATNLQQVLFYLSGPAPAPSIQFVVSCTFHRAGTDRLALGWLRSLPPGDALLDRSSGVLFPHLREFWPRVQQMGVDNASLFLQDRIEATSRGSLTLFGISVDRNLVLWAGPTVLCALLMFFWLHLRQVNVASSSETHRSEISAYPWVACFPNRASAAATYGFAIIFPIVASALLLVTHGASWREPSTAAGAVLTLGVAIFGVLAGAEILRLRHRL